MLFLFQDLYKDYIENIYDHVSNHEVTYYGLNICFEYIILYIIIRYLFCEIVYYTLPLTRRLYFNSAYTNILTT